MVARLLAADEPGDVEDVESEAVTEPEPLSLPPGMTVPPRRQARGVADLPEEYQRFLALIAAAPRPVACRYVCEQFQGSPVGYATVLEFRGAGDR